MQIMIGLTHYPLANTISMADEVADMVVDIEVDKVAELVLDQTFENQEARQPPICFGLFAKFLANNTESGFTLIT